MNAIEERFFGKVAKTATCWNWTGVKGSKGYGNFKLDGDMRLAHRVAYVLAGNELPDSVLLDHACSNRACVRADHLRPVTNKENMENLTTAHRTSQSGFRGVIPAGNRWRAQAKHRGRSYYAGTHDTPEEAAEAARQLRLSLFTHNDADRRSAC